MSSPGVFADLAAQRACWHPVAFASEITDRPAHADLLGEPLVIWRGADGTPRAMSDLCVHRGTALSLGWVKGDELVCAYHGWRYGADGRCTAIPQKEDPAAVPAKARIAAYRAQERYGLIWVALDEPRWPLPEVPELEDGEWIVVPAGPYRWRCDAARQVENFTDFGHFPWVHPGLLGDPERPVVPPYQVATDGHVLHYQIVRPEAPNSDDFPVFGNEQAGPPERRSRYELHLPYTIVLRLGWGGERGMVYFFASQPVSAGQCAGYVVIGRNYNTGQQDRVIQEFEDTIFGQDQVVVESQRPERVPFDLAAELHLKFDAVAVAYRKAMRDLGLAASDAIGITAELPFPRLDSVQDGRDRFDVCPRRLAHPGGRRRRRRRSHRGARRGTGPGRAAIGGGRGRAGGRHPHMSQRLDPPQGRAPAVVCGGGRLPGTCAAQLALPALR